jgi:hypothetical protein
MDCRISGNDEKKISAATLLVHADPRAGYAIQQPRKMETGELKR